MQKRLTIRWLLRMLACAAVCLCALAFASAREVSPADTLLAQVRLPKVLGDGTFEYGGQRFNRLLIPRYVTEQFEHSAYAVLPGQCDNRVTEVKQFLFSNDNFPYNEYVTYSQVRPPKAEGESREWIETYFDEHLAIFLQTLYRFCGLEDKEPVIDELTCYLLESLPNVSQNMSWDIESAYKYELIQQGKQGTVSRDGSLDNLYYFAQTDPDWGGEEFQFFKIESNPTYPNGVTIKDRGCGCACASMVFSTYHMVEITPRITAAYADAGSWHVSYGLPNEYFEGIAKFYRDFEKDRYGTTLQSPEILEKDTFTIDQLKSWLRDDKYMAIIHVGPGAFTSQEHYMVLEDYREVDGKGYFLVADPYVQSSRYKDTDQLLAVEGSTNEGLIYATPELIYRDCMAIVLFRQSREAFPLRCKTTAPEGNWLS